MLNRWQRAIALRFLGGAACLVAGSLVAQEAPEILETIDVRVVNVDVVVADAAGRPVRGLEREDFELLVEGRPVALDYFSPVVGGRIGDAGVTAGVPPPLPYLAVVYDGRGVRPASARRAVDTLCDRLDELLAGTRGLMVLRQGTRLVVEQPMTRDRERLIAALERLAAARTPALDAADRTLLMLQLENTNPPRIARESEEDLTAERARRLLGQIHHQAEAERFAAEESGRQLRSVVRSVAGLPGRKAILLLGQGLDQQPAEALYRLWWSKFARYASEAGVINIESEIGRSRSDDLLGRVVEEANVHRVAFYSHDPTGVRPLAPSAEHASLEANQLLADETERTLNALVDLAVATGGVGRVQSPGIGPLLDEMLNGFVNYYSLGFTPREGESGRIRVRLREPGLQVRYLTRFVQRTAAQQLEEVTLATLLTAAENNLLEVSVELGRAEIQPDGTFVVPLLVKVPMVRLALLPRQARHVGRLSFVVMAQAADGGLSRPASGAVPIELANAELLSAMGRMAGYRLQLRVAGGEQVVAIGVRDEISGQDSTLRLVLRSGRGV